MEKVYQWQVSCYASSLFPLNFFGSWPIIIAG